MRRALARQLANRGEAGRYPVEVLEPRELEALLKACGRSKTGLRNRAPITLMWRAGLRVSEALALEPRDIDLNAGTIRVPRGKGDKTRVVGIDGRLAEVRELLADRGGTLYLAARAMEAVELELWAGDAVAAVELATESCRLLEELGERGWLSTAASMLGQALYALDRLDEAETWANRSRELGASDDLATQALWRQVEAKVLARRGDVEEAERLAREAIAITDPTENLNFRADSLVDLANVLELIGNAEEARVTLERALDLYERKGNVVMAERTGARLTEASGP